MAVYEWIAERCAGLRVVDLASGEGYGLRSARADRLRRDPWTRTRSLRARDGPIPPPQPELQRGSSSGLRRASRRRGLLQTIEHIHEPGRLLERIAAMAPPPTSPPRTGSPSRRRGGEVRQPLASPRVTTPASTGSCSSRISHASSCWASSTRGSCRVHELAIRAGWDPCVHPALRITKPFYDRFIPAISARDFRLARRTSTRRWTSSRSAMARPVGDLAIVLHSHMP